MHKRVIAVLCCLCLAVTALFLCGSGELPLRTAAEKFGISGEPSRDAVRVACVGDSLTYGYMIAERGKYAYPAQLQQLLGDGFQVKNFGLSGYTIQNNADRPYRGTELFLKSLRFDADIMVFLMGGNDAKTYNWKGKDAFRRELCEFLDYYGDSTIILCTPTTMFYMDGRTEGPANYGVDPQYMAAIAEVCREVAQERGYVLVDIHTLTADHPEWFPIDGGHPDRYGAEAIAGAVEEAISGLSFYYGLTYYLK